MSDYVLNYTGAQINEAIAATGKVPTTIQTNATDASFTVTISRKSDSSLSFTIPGATGITAGMFTPSIRQEIFNAIEANSASIEILNRMFESWQRTVHRIRYNLNHLTVISPGAFFYADSESELTATLEKDSEDHDYRFVVKKNSVVVNPSAVDLDIVEEQGYFTFTFYDLDGAEWEITEE